MKLRSTAAALVLSLPTALGCSSGAPQRSITEPPPAAPPPPTAASIACPHGIELRERGSFQVGTSEGNGQIGITAAGGVERWWHFSVDKPPRLQVTTLVNAQPSSAPEDAERLGIPSMVEAWEVASSGAVTAVATKIRRGPTNADIEVHLIGKSGKTSSIPVASGDDINAAPVIAAGPPGRFAVVWVTGSGPSRSIHFALVDSSGVVARSVIDNDVSPGGIALVHTGRGYLAVYAPSYGGTTPIGGMTALSISPKGQVLSKRAVFPEAPILACIAAWDGEAAGVAFLYGYTGAGFTRLAEDGTPLIPPIKLELSDDSSAAFQPSSIAASQGVFWIGLDVSFHLSVLAAASNQARVVAVRPDGTFTNSVVLPQGYQGSYFTVVDPSPAGARGLSMARASTKWTLHGFEASCRAQPSDGRTADPCSPRLTPFGRAGYLPVRARFQLASAGSDLFIASRTPGDSLANVKPRVKIARMARDGAVRWSASTKRDLADEDPPAIAVSGEDVALAFASTDHDLVFTALSAETGAPRASRAIRAPEPTHNACIAARDGGYLVVRLHRLGSSLLRLRPDGSEESSQPLSSEVWNGCAIARLGSGWVVAYTKRGRVTETNHLYLQALDARGAPAGSPLKIDTGFARDPALLAQGDGALLAWTGPGYREVIAVPIGQDGRLAGDPQELTRVGQKGLSGFSLIPEGGGATLIFATDKDYGERRLCLK